MLDNWYLSITLIHCQVALKIWTDQLVTFWSFASFLSFLSAVTLAPWNNRMCKHPTATYTFNIHSWQLMPWFHDTGNVMWSFRHHCHSIAGTGTDLPWRIHPSKAWIGSCIWFMEQLCVRRAKVYSALQEEGEPTKSAAELKFRA